MTALVLLMVGAYLLGSVPAAYLVAKRYAGIDVRQYGSGNVGVSNIMKVVPKRLTVLVVIFDAGKGIITVLVARALGLDMFQQLVVGLATIVGHNWSVFLHFSAGRGALTTAGVVFALAPRLALALGPVAFAGAPFGLLPVTSLIAAILLSICSWYSSVPVFSWLFDGPLETGSQFYVTLGFVAVFLVLVIRRLTAPRTSLTGTVSGKGLFINRLLFDRDIKDREAWINRKPLENQAAKKGVNPSE